MKKAQESSDKLLRQYTLCHVDEHCCPQIMVKKEGIDIKDDFGGKVKFTKDQWNLLVEGIQAGKIK